MADCICVRRGDGPEGCGICNETGTTPDIAGLCEELRESAAQIFGCYAPIAKITEAADTLERQADEIKRLRTGLEKVAAYYGTGHRVTEIARAALTGEDT